MRKTIPWTYLLLAAVSVVACGRSAAGLARCRLARQCPSATKASNPIGFARVVQ
jgi:hypothetical protein